MSGVWVFKNGVTRLVENPTQSGEGSAQSETDAQTKVLVYLETGEIITSYATLEDILTSVGWTKYLEGDTDLLQFNKRSSIDLISLPKNFSNFKSLHMYDILCKIPNTFHVKQA